MTPDLSPKDLEEWVETIYDADALDVGTERHDTMYGLLPRLERLARENGQDPARAFLFGLGLHLASFESPSAEAQSWLESAIELDPDWLEPRVQLGCVFSQRAEWDSVVDVLSGHNDLDSVAHTASWRACTVLELYAIAGLATGASWSVDALRTYRDFVRGIGDDFRECPPPNALLNQLLLSIASEMLRGRDLAVVSELLNLLEERPPYGTSQSLIASLVDSLQKAGLGTVEPNG